MNKNFTLHQGSSPLVVSLPHAGTAIPVEMQKLYTPKALLVADTDWLLDILYNYVIADGASLLVPKLSRYVIDLNRPPEDTAIYPGVNNTGLCPMTDFEGVSIYQTGCAPDAAAIVQRRHNYWQPYHDALEAELTRVKTIHGYAVLLDGHSINSRLPWLFDGKLPDLNIGTFDGNSCAKAIRDAVVDLLYKQTDFSSVMDGRFKGGYITRHFGKPEQNIHAVQLEMCWCTYMHEQPPFKIDPARQPKIAAFLKQLTQLLSKTNIIQAPQE